MRLSTSEMISYAALISATFSICGEFIHATIERRPFFEHPDWFVIIAGFATSMIFSFLLTRNEGYLMLLEEANLHDELTGVFSRAYIPNAVRAAVSSARRDNKFFTIFVVDINDFKKINDKLGHNTGDKALCFVAQSMQKIMREDEDVITRSGIRGDEFTIICPTSSPAEILSRIKTSIPKDNGYGISISIGMSFEKIAKTEHYSDAQLDELYLRHYKIADKEMYEEKERWKAGN